MELNLRVFTTANIEICEYEFQEQLMGIQNQIYFHLIYKFNIHKNTYVLRNFLFNLIENIKYFKPNLFENFKHAQWKKKILYIFMPLSLISILLY